MNSTPLTPDERARLGEQAERYAELARQLTAYWEKDPTLNQPVPSVEDRIRAALVRNGEEADDAKVQSLAAKMRADLQQRGDKAEARLKAKLLLLEHDERTQLQYQAEGIAELERQIAEYQAKDAARNQPVLSVEDRIRAALVRNGMEPSAANVQSVVAEIGAEIDQWAAAACARLKDRMP